VLEASRKINEALLHMQQSQIFRENTEALCILGRVYSILWRL